MITKIRNRLIALSCFLLFLAIGTAFLWHNSTQKPFAVILFIGDGMSPSLLTATRLYEGGADHRLALEDFPQAALTRTYANDFAVPDTASAATALATGERVNRQSLGMSIEGKPLVTLLEEASLKNRATGFISNDSLMGETVAAFYAKSLNAQDHVNTARQLLEHTPIDLFIGGGKKEFLEASSEAHKTASLESGEDDQNFLKKLTAKGTLIVNSMQELADIPSWKSPPIMALLADHEFSFCNETQTGAAQPSLPELVRLAIERLQHSRHGYFLVIDDALIGKAASLNDGEQLFHQISEMDQAIQVARHYAGTNALIMVTGKQNLGGLRMNGAPFRNDKGVAVIGVNTQGVPSITWSTGPGHHSTPDNSKEPLSILAEPAAFMKPTALGIAEDTLTLGVGPGSEQIHGFIDLITVHDVIKKEL